ncbi:MAG TPA: ATP-binding protein [Alphaproteobacteria bacterium]|nr:ATP-binding protein [Alphaproteobacteria bacterium]
MKTKNHWPKQLAIGSAAFAIVLGVSVLIGWVTHIFVLVQVLPNLPFMVKNTAASFLLSGIALLALALKGPRWLMVAAAGLTCVVNGLTIIEYLFHVNLGTGALLGPTNFSVRARPPGRVAPLASICFTLASLVILLAPRVLSTRTALFLGLTGSMIAAFGLASVIGTFGNATMTAFNSAVGFLVFGFGMVSLAWDAEGGPASSPPWLLGGVAIAAIAAAVGLWQAEVDTTRRVFDFLPLAVLIGGCVIVAVFALTVYLAHRGHAQAAALRQSEARLHRTEAFLLEAEMLSATGSFSLNPLTGEHWWSAQTYRIFDVDPRMPPDFEFMRARTHPDDLHLVDRVLECAKHGEDVTTEFRLRMADGTVKYLHVVAHAIQSPLDEQSEFVGAVRDITERRLSEEVLGKVRSELARVARATSFSALTASIAHEVNQPLSGIITNASLCHAMLANDPPDIDGARDAARRMIRDGNRASDVIARLRGLFTNKRPTAGALDLNEAAREVIALSLSELQRNRVVLLTDFCGELPPVIGDRVQLQQVILNLLLNASDAMHGIDDRPRRLTICTKLGDNHSVRLDVQDTGVGLAPQDAERVFEAFYTTKDGGMGIGLSVSRSIIETHRGRIWATTNDGPGATFSFAIPYEPAGATA